MKSARVDVVLELLPDIAPLLRDHGLKIIGIQNARLGLPDAVRLIVEGWTLPDACEGADPLDAPVVMMTITQEVYGQQRITRISSIDLVPADRKAAA